MAELPRRKSLLEMVNEGGDPSDVDRVASSLQKNLIPFAKLGPRFHELLQDGCLEERMFGDGAISLVKLAADAVSRLVPRVGGMYVSTPAATTISVGGTYYKAAGTTTAGILVEFSMPTNNRLTYVGADVVNAVVVAASSVSSVSAAQALGLKLAVNGSVVGATYTSLKTDGASEKDAVTVIGCVELAQNDYVELWITNETGATNVTVEAMNFLALGFLKV